ncbi:serine/threonine protein kinase [Pyxidicoccus sp. QH1ED-7-1]|nr:serine/threonine protein kinase [Pyxidicoccus xibeiensis]
MGEVWLARESTGAGTGATVAVKLLLPHLAEDPRFVELLRHEAERASRLDHPGIVRVRGLEETESGPILVMEHVPGPSLRWVLERSRALDQRLPVGFVARALVCVCEALHHAHQAGLVHADLAPDNVLVTPEGDVKVVDFGVARLLHGSEGTPRHARRGYTAPEVLAGGEPREPADLYAAGAMLEELAAFSEAPEALEPVAHRALTADMTARPAGALELRDALAPLASGFEAGRLGGVITHLLAAEPRRQQESAGATTTGILAPEPPAAAVPRRRTPAKKAVVALLLAAGLAALGMLLATCWPATSA